MTDDKKPEDNSTRNAVADKFEAMGEIGSREMTDDKGAGEGPYYVTDEYCNEVGGRRFVIRGPGLNAQTTASLIREELVGSARIRNRAFAEGRKAERERCVEIARYYFYLERYAAQEIEKRILGGQDAK